MVEFARRYDWQSIHHDYIRYPGDLAPDRYCFCDDCLEQIPRYAGYFSEMHPDQPFHHELYDRPYIEAHWEGPPYHFARQLENIAARLQKPHSCSKVHSFRAVARTSIYFFYKFRADAIERFAKDTAEAVRAANSNIEISAAVFKNLDSLFALQRPGLAPLSPLQSNTASPMDYREHYPGDMAMHLDLLEESIRQQQQWAKDYKYYWWRHQPQFTVQRRARSGNSPHRIQSSKTNSNPRQNRSNRHRRRL